MRLQGSAGSCVAVVLLLVGCSDATQPVSDTAAEASPTPPTEEQGTPFFWEGVRKPPAVSAEATSLGDDRPVIGIVVGNQPRAYAVEAMSSMTSHVVNDVIADRPVSVTYCDRTDCTRVLTRSQGREPINLWLGGWTGQEMLLFLDGNGYPQNSADLPLQEHPFERTTWGEWKSKHPQTEIYLGQLRDVLVAPAAGEVQVVKAITVVIPRSDASAERLQNCEMPGLLAVAVHELHAGLRRAIAPANRGCLILRIDRRRLYGRWVSRCVVRRRRGS